MKIFISGSGGFIGNRLVAHLRAGGHEVVRMVRSQPPGDEAVFWQPASGRFDRSVLEEADAVINLAGENIAAGRWTEERKRSMRDSRVVSTQLLAEAIAAVGRRPRVLVNASAVGIYGNRGDEPLDESSAPGSGYLADVCRDWEAATEPAERAGVRVVRARFGVVLDPHGGALAKMLPYFKSGIGGRIGSGKQYISWITLDDVVWMMDHVLANESVRGAINAVAPNPVRQAEFASELGKALGRPALVPTPATALRLMFGQMAEETILASARVFPRSLLAGGFEFRDPDIETAFERFFSKDASA
ncbi:MAG: TIGR01777 family oxidoreductase [Candidatus Sumerlaeia bacterium]